MTLLNLITNVKERFPSADAKEISAIAGEFEGVLINEIFSPNGIISERGKLESKSDANTKLFLSSENLSLYLFYVYAALSLKEMDFEASNAYSSLFNKRFAEFAAFVRRNNLPVKNTLLKGGV